MKKYLALTLICLMSYSIAAVSEAAVRVPHTHARAPHAHVAVGAHTPAIDANVRVAVPPRIAIQAPEMVVVSSGNAYVYITPKISGLYFYDSYWYRYYGGNWFRATAYNGEWVSIAVAPAAVVSISSPAETRSQVAVEIKPEASVVEQGAIVAPAVETVGTSVTAPILEIQEPELVVVPSEDTYIYMIPNVVGVYFYDGYWYRYYESAWFRADIYNGPWISISVAPTAIVAIDPWYPFYLPTGYYTIGYADFHAHWRSWGHDRHWHNHAWFKHEMKSDVRKARIKSIKADHDKGIDRFKLSQKKPGKAKSAKSVKSNKSKKSDQAHKSVKSVKTNKSIKKDQLNKDSKTKVARKNSKIKKSVKNDRLDKNSKTKAAKSDKSNQGIKSNKFKKDDLTIKSAQSIKSSQNLKGAQALKNGQTFKKTGTLTNAQSNKNLQTSKNIQGNKSANMLPKQQTQSRQNYMQKTNGFERR